MSENEKATQINELPKKNGAETQNRTGDASLFRAALYQLSYLGTNLPYNKLQNFYYFREN